MFGTTSSANAKSLHWRKGELTDEASIGYWHVQQTGSTATQNNSSQAARSPRPFSSTQSYVGCLLNSQIRCSGPLNQMSHQRHLMNRTRSRYALTIQRTNRHFPHPLFACPCWFRNRCSRQSLFLFHVALQIHGIFPFRLPSPFCFS